MAISLDERRYGVLALRRVVGDSALRVLNSDQRGFLFLAELQTLKPRCSGYNL